jgi:hypothetical protein
METRVVSGDATRAMRSAVATLADLGYTVDVANTELGLITASRQTRERSGEITHEQERPGHQGMATWQKVLLIGTGLILVIALIAAIAGSDDDKDKDRDGDHDRDRRHHDDLGDHSTVVVAGESDGPTIYEYRVTVNVESEDATHSRVRVSSQGRESQGRTVRRAGPVRDPAFFDRFFAGLDRALRIADDARPPAPADTLPAGTVAPDSAR